MDNFKRDFKFIPSKIRAIGGGSVNEQWMQGIANISGKTVETIYQHRMAGSIGVAACVFVGSGIFNSFHDVEKLIKVKNTYLPDLQVTKTYDELFLSYKSCTTRYEARILKQMQTGLKNYKMENIEIIKQQIIDGGKRLLKEGLVSGTWGNISIRVDDTFMLVTPSGRPYEELTEKDIVLVNYHTSEYEGDSKPSSEKELHCEIYRTRENINAVIHTHQMNASTVAAARREVPPVLDDQAQILGPSVRVADYALPSTKKLARKTVKALQGRMAALMANHGAVCIGRDLEEAFVACQVLEKACKTFIEAEFLGGAKSISKFEAILMHQFYLKKYAAKSTRNN